MDVDSWNIGKNFIVSFPGEIPGDAVLYFIQDNGIGGIILFADHCRDRDSLKSWLNDFKKSLGRPLLVAVDQEGGRVRRFTSRFPMLESPRYYGHREDIKGYRDDLARVCEQLRETGVNFNLVPSVDLFDTDPDHVLDTRTFSDNPEIVSRFARATLEVHQQMGLLTCAKHFPGLGRSRGDPHLTRAVADLSAKDFEEIELPPFADIIEAGVPSVMVTHLSLPGIDENPAIMSETIINGWLKGKLGFRGAVVTDDLLMKGAADFEDIENLPGRAFAAGADLLLFGQDLKQARRAFETFHEQWHSERFSEERRKDAGYRVNKLLEAIRE